MTVTGRDALIAEALFSRVASFSYSPALPVSYPEPAETFEPPADGKYLEVFHFPNRPAWQGLASGRLDQGLSQINVVWPKNAGLIAPLQVAAAVIAHFPLGYRIFNGSVRVKVSGQPWAAAPLIEPDRVIVPVTIPWAA